MHEIFRIKESELIRESRKVFRESLVSELAGVMTREDLAKFEGWFIKMSLDGYWRRVGGVSRIDSQISILNYSVLMTANKIYSESFVATAKALESWHVRRSDWILNTLEREVKNSEQIVIEFPDKLEEIENLNKKVVDAYGNSVGKMVRSVFEGLGTSIGYCLLGVGVVSGAVGYVVGKTVRESGEVLIRRLTKGSGG